MLGDGSHPSSAGSLLAAYTLFETIWGETAVGNTFTPIQGAEDLQVRI